MDSKALNYYKDWSKQTRRKSNLANGNLGVVTLLQDLFTKCGFSSESFINYKKNVHPVLLIRYAGAWDKCRHLSVKEWESLDKAWLEICWRQKFYNSGALSVFKTFDELKNAITIHFNGNQIMESSHEDALKALARMGQQLRDSAIEVETPKEEVKQYVKPTMPNTNYNALAEALKSDSKPVLKEQPVAPSLKDVFEEQSVETKLFFDNESSEDFLKSKIPSIGGNQILIHKGVLKTHYSIGLQVQHQYLKVKTIKSTGDRYIVFSDVPGILSYKNKENQVVVEHNDLCTAFLELYGAKKYVLLTVANNASEDEDLEAFKITNVIFK